MSIDDAGEGNAHSIKLGIRERALSTRPIISTDGKVKIPRYWPTESEDAFRDTPAA